MKRLRDFTFNTFVGGLVVILPLLIFAYLVNWVIGFFGNLLDPIVKMFPIFMNIYVAKIIAFLVIILICFSVGIFVRTRFGNSLFSWFENALLRKLPFYSTIKETVFHFIGRDKSPFSKVVLVKPYGGNAKMIGFVTSQLNNDDFTIFVPTAPNPTSGFVIILAEKDIEYLDISAEEAMRTIIGLGKGAETLIYQDRQPKKKSFWSKGS